MLLGYTITGAGVLGVLVLFGVTRAWAPSARLVLLATSASLSVAGFWVTELGSKNGLRPRRLGEIVPVGEQAVGGSSAPAYVVSGGLRSRGEDRVRFGVKRRNSLIAVGVMAPVAVLSILFGLDGLADDELSATTLVAILVSGPAVYVTVRSLIRIVLARRAITFTADHVRLGVALGYVPPLVIDRHRLAQIRQVPSLGLVVDHKIVRRLRDSHLEDRDGLFEWITTNWPEVTVLPVRYELEVEHPTLINEFYDEAFDFQLLPGTYESREAALEAARRYMNEHAGSLKPDAFVWILATEGSVVESVGGVYPDGTEGD